MSDAPKKLTSVITGDIIQSRKMSASVWLPRLKKALAPEGKSPRAWQVYRGDSFQVEVRNPADALRAAIRIKAAIKTIKNLDVRMAIGIGDKRYASARVAESDGEAFVFSGEKFETLKRSKRTLAIKTLWAEFDRDMNVCLNLASIPMDDWTRSSAELIQMLVSQPNLTQKALARRLGVTQPSVSERQNRAHFDRVMELEELYREKISLLISRE